MTTAEPTTRKRIWKALIPVAVISSVALGALSALKFGSSESLDFQAHLDLDVGTALPDFPIERLGKPSVMISEMDAKVILINFWASWCPACMVEMPSLAKLHASYKSQGLEIIGVNVDENPEIVIPRTVKRLALPFVMAVDSKGELSDLFDVHALPLTIILDRNRTILHIEAGERDWNANDVRTQMEQWLAG